MTEEGLPTEAGIRMARKTELRAWCRQQGLADSGSVEQLRGRLFNLLEFSEKQAESAMQEPPRRDRKPAFVAVALIITVVLLVAAVIAALRPGQDASPEGAEPAIPLDEANYLREISNVLSRGTNSAQRWADIMVDHLEAGISASSAVSLLNTEKREMKSLLSAVGFAVIPCSAYASAHNDVTNGLDTLVKAFDYTISGIIHPGSGDLTVATNHLNDAKEFLRSGTDRIDAFARAAPNC